MCTRIPGVEERIKENKKINSCKTPQIQEVLEERCEGKWQRRKKRLKSWFKYMAVQEHRGL